MTLALDLRNGADSLLVLAHRDLDAFWREVAVYEAAAYAGDLQARETLRTALHDVLPALTGSYQDAAIALAADLYDLERDRVNVPGTYRAPGIEIPDGGHVLAGWALTEAVNPEGLHGLIQGGLTKRVMQAANRTVMGAAQADPRADGWQRVARGGCDFCRVLAGRGAVYTRESADFAAHNSCRCVATVAWTGEERPVQAYTPSARGTTAADRARVREWIATHDIP